MKAVPFFSDDITIKPHTATRACDLGVTVRIRDFADGQPVSLYELHNDEYLLRRQDGRFVEGKEVVA